MLAPYLLHVGDLHERRNLAVAVDAVLAASAHTVHEPFRTQRIEHAFLEPESTLAVPAGEADARTLHVYSGGQGVWDDRNDIASVLQVERVRV